MTRVAVAALAAAVVACSPTAEGQAPTVEPGVLSACVVPSPTGAVDAEAGLDGLDVQLLRAVADDLGLELRLRTTSLDAVLSGAATAAPDCEVAAGGMLAGDPVDAALVTSRPHRDEVVVMVGLGAPGVLPAFSETQVLAHPDRSDLSALASRLSAFARPYPSVVDAVAAMASGRARGLLLDPADVDAALAGVEGARRIGSVPTGRRVVLLHRAQVDPLLVELTDEAISRVLDAPSWVEARARWEGPELAAPGG